MGGECGLVENGGWKRVENGGFGGFEGEENLQLRPLVVLLLQLQYLFRVVSGSVVGEEFWGFWGKRSSCGLIEMGRSEDYVFVFVWCLRNSSGVTSLAQEICENQ